VPYKNLEVRRIKARHYQRQHRLRLSEERKKEIRQQNNAMMKAWYAALPLEEKQVYLTKKNSATRSTYASSPEMRKAKIDSGFRQYREKREEVVVYLGGRCASSTCLWINQDGTRGCTDRRCLQIDHVKGDGAKKRKSDSSENGTVFYRKVLTTTPGEEYQLLCANCNWIKRHENREVPKARKAVAGGV
jgi:hypothetical protein